MICPHPAAKQQSPIILLPYYPAILTRSSPPATRDRQPCNRRFAILSSSFILPVPSQFHPSGWLLRIRIRAGRGLLRHSDTLTLSHIPSLHLGHHSGALHHSTRILSAQPCTIVSVRYWHLSLSFSLFLLSRSSDTHTRTHTISLPQLSLAVKACCASNFLTPIRLSPCLFMALLCPLNLLTSRATPLDPQLLFSFFD